MSKISSLVLSLTEKLMAAITGCPELTFVGDPVLRTHCVEVSLAEGLEIAKKLKAALKTYREISGFGRGLAAPQIGLAKRVFVTFVDNEFQTYINPAIIQSSQTLNYYRELCLSSGSLWGDVARPDWIVIRFIDETGAILEKRFEGFLARLLQHEYDHLQGIVNLDKAEKGSIEFVTTDPLKEQLRNAPDRE